MKFIYTDSNHTSYLIDSAWSLTPLLVRLSCLEVSAMVDFQTATVCCMCGDVGFSDKLFRCHKCRNRFQHSYGLIIPSSSYHHMHFRIHHDHVMGSYVAGGGWMNCIHGWSQVGLVFHIYWKKHQPNNNHRHHHHHGCHNDILQGTSSRHPGMSATYRLQARAVHDRLLLLGGIILWELNYGWICVDFGRYCSNYYSESSERMEVCDWCQTEERSATRHGSSSKKSVGGLEAGVTSRSEYSGDKIKQHDREESGEKGKNPSGAPSPRPTTRRYKLLKDVMC